MARLQLKHYYRVSKRYNNMEYEEDLINRQL